MSPRGHGRLLVVAKTAAAVRRHAVGALRDARWVSWLHVTVENLDEAESSEDDFDACMTAAALLRCVLEGSPLCPSQLEAPSEGGILGTGTVNLGLPQKTFARRDREGLFASPSGHVITSRLTERVTASRSVAKAFHCPIVGCNKVFQARAAAGTHTSDRSVSIRPGTPTSSAPRNESDISRWSFRNSFADIRDGLPGITMSYDLFEHRHRFAVWAAARASQRGFTSVDVLREALERSDIVRFVQNPESLETDEIAFLAHHRSWCTAVVERLQNRGIANVSYGRAAKLIAVYLKAMIVVGPHATSSLASVAHPPIDRILLQNLPSSDVASPNKSKWRVTTWTTLDAAGYYALVSELREVLAKNGPLWPLEVLDGHQRLSNLPIG